MDHTQGSQAHAQQAGYARAVPAAQQVPQAPMTPTQLQNIILRESADIAEVIFTGAGWEIWLQVTLLLRLRRQRQAAREVPYYPNDSHSPRLDLLVADNAGVYAIELKVESATNAAQGLMQGITQDIDKIAWYPLPDRRPLTRWVVGIAYSAEAQGYMQQCVTNRHNAIFAIGNNGIGVLVVTVGTESYR